MNSTEKLITYNPLFCEFKFEVFCIAVEFSVSLSLSLVSYNWMLENENFAITFRGALKPEQSKKCKIFKIILIKWENFLENALWSCDLRNFLRMIFISRSKKRKTWPSDTMFCLVVGRGKQWTKGDINDKIQSLKLRIFIRSDTDHMSWEVWYAFLYGRGISSSWRAWEHTGGRWLSASSVMDVLKADTLCFRAALLGVIKAIGASVSWCVDSWLTPPWLLLAMPLTSPRGWGFKWPRIISPGVSTLIFLLWSGTVKLMALCRI